MAFSPRLTDEELNAVHARRDAVLDSVHAVAAGEGGGSVASTMGRVHSLETFGLVDGPGVRFVVILQGCYWRCAYCHNPETWATGAGEGWTAEDLYRKVWRYHNYWGETGGVTVGGGEPLLQMEFVTELFGLLKQRGVHTAIDTAGGPFKPDDPEWMAAFERLMDVTDLVLLDLKMMDAAGHKKLTGWDNSPTLELAQWLSDHGKAMWIRHVLVSGLTDGEGDLRDVRAFIDGLATVQRVEVLPYNALAEIKWNELGLNYSLREVEEPTAEQKAAAETILGAC